MYNKCYNAKFQVQDDEQQLNGKRVPIHLAGSYSFLFPVVSEVCSGGALPCL